MENRRTGNDSSVQGVIKEIDDGGMIIERNSGEREIVNLDFVTCIREYPRKKNRRLKSFPFVSARKGKNKGKYIRPEHKAGETT